MESQWSYNGANGLSVPNKPNAMEPMVHIFNKFMPGTLNGAQWGIVPPLRSSGSMTSCLHLMFALTTDCLFAGPCKATPWQKC